MSEGEEMLADCELLDEVDSLKAVFNDDGTRRVLEGGMTRSVYIHIICVCVCVHIFVCARACICVCICHIPPPPPFPFFLQPLRLLGRHYNWQNSFRHVDGKEVISANVVFVGGRAQVCIYMDLTRCNQKIELEIFCF